MFMRFSGSGEGVLMLLDVPKVDARRHAFGSRFQKRPVTDLESGKTVGYLSISQGRSPIHNGGPEWEPTRHISLFDGKYQGRFDKHEECVAFARGVEAVLNHLHSLGQKASERFSAEQDSPEVA
jgi:hypothetical protein